MQALLHPVPPNLQDGEYSGLSGEGDSFCLFQVYVLMILGVVHLIGK